MIVEFVAKISIDLDNLPPLYEEFRDVLILAHDLNRPPQIVGQDKWDRFSKMLGGRIYSVVPEGFRNG